MRTGWLFLGIVLLLNAPAFATNVSTADPNYPQAYDDIDSEPLRDQFNKIINDIDNLWAAIGPNFLEANQLLGALVSGKAAALPIPSCFGVTNALTWRPGLGFGCNDIESSGGGSDIGLAPALTVFAGPLSGSPATGSFRALTGNDLPLPSSNSIGGVKSGSGATHQFMNGISTSGSLLFATPSFADITGILAASQLPTPTPSSMGGTQSIAVVPHNFMTGISTAGVPTQAQPSFPDIGGNISVSQLASGASASSSTFFRGDGTWATPPSGGSSSLSSIASATATNTISNAGFSQTWNWPSLGNSTALAIFGTSAGNGSVLASTLTGASNTGYAGLFTNASSTGYAGYFSGAVNVTGQLTAPNYNPNVSSAIGLLNVASGGPNVTKRLPLATDDWTHGYFGDGSVDHLYLSNSATGCGGTPTLSIAQPGGTGGITATGHFLMSTTTVGSVVVPVIDTPGKGYTSNPAVTVSNTTGCSSVPAVTAHYTPNGQFWLGPDKKIYQGHQTDTGAAVWTYFPTPSLPLDSIINPISAATVVAGGSGYNTNDTINLNNGTVLKVATVSGSAVATVSVQTPGAWQCWTTSAQSQISTSGSGTGATFTVTAQTAVAAYGDHLLTQCYTAGNWMDATRAIDGAVLTLKFLPNGDPDVSSLQKFCSGSTCTRTKWYDQGGQGNDATAGATVPIVDFNQQLNGVPVAYNGNMLVPSGASYNTNSASEYMLTRSEPNPWALGGYQFQGNDSSGFISYYSGVTKFIADVVDGPLVGYIPSLASELIGMSISSSSSGSYSIDDFEFQCSSGCASSHIESGGILGNNSTLTSGLAASMALIMPRGFSAAERAAFRASVYETFNVFPQIRTIGILQGDSRTAGNNSTNDVGYPLQLEPYLAAPARLFNVGYTGYSMPQYLGNFYNRGEEAYIWAQPHDSNSFISLWDGYNDMLFGTSAATIYSNMVSYTSMVHSIGARLALANDTEAPNGSADTSILNALNAAITANTAGADIIMPFTSDPVWGCPPCENAGSYGYTGQSFGIFPHPSTFGYGFVAKDVASSLNPTFK